MNQYRFFRGNHTTFVRSALVVIAVVLLTACNQGLPLPPSAAPHVVTISATGVSPAAVTGRSAYVAFGNRDTVAHDIRSNPHPDHTECPELNVGRIGAGQTLSSSSQLGRGRTCGYHDETRPDDLRFQGTIAID